MYSSRKGPLYLREERVVLRASRGLEPGWLVWLRYLNRRWNPRHPKKAQEAGGFDQKVCNGLIGFLIRSQGQDVAGG